MRSLLRSFALVVLPGAVAVAGVCAQANATDRYAAEAFVVNSSSWVYSENADGTGYSERTVAVDVRSEAAVRVFGVIHIPFASASSHVEFAYARVRHKDGSVTETPATDVIEQPTEVTREAPFYSDMKEAQLPVKNLQPGDTLEYKARVVSTRAEAANQFWGQETFLDPGEGVALKEVIELRVPAASAVTVWTNPALGFKPVESTEGATRIYRWQTVQLLPTAGPEAEAAKKAVQGKPLTPAAEANQLQGRLPSVEWTSFPDWAAVGAWYRGLESSRAVPDDEIKAKVAQLIAGKTTEDEKVKAVYAYVATQIRYIGVAFGVGRFQPHEAADVLHNQYGDCKDKATLLAAMLAVLGLHADTVLIGSEIRMNEAVPSPQSFNHAITRVKVGDKEVWLDATTEVAPYEVLLYALRDKLALVIPEQGPAMLLRTPKELPFENTVTWKAVGTLDKEGTSESHITLTLRGDIELLYRAVIRQVPPGQYDDVGPKITQSMGYSGKVTHVRFSRPEDTDGPFVMAFDYEREKAGDWDNLRTVPQVMPIPLPVLDEKDLPSTLIILGAPHVETSEAEMTLPLNWTAELPEAVHEASKWAKYDMTYRFEKGTVYTRRVVEILLPALSPGDWKAYKKLTDAINAGNDAYVQLIRAGTAKADTPAKAATDLDANALKPGILELYEQVDADLKKMDTVAATADLKKVQAIDPKAPRLWVGYAAIALLRWAPIEAIDDCKKELALHPGEVEVYPVLAGAQAMHGDNAGMMTTLNTWAAAEPDNRGPWIILAQASYQKKDYRAAAGYGEKALGLDPRDNSDSQQEQLESITGESELKSGSVSAGEARLKPLLEKTENPSIMNNVGYALADANLDLPLDEEKVRAALDKLDVETQAWTLDESPQILRSTTSALAAAWDTMGWILYREGKAAEAKTYIDAAHHNEQHAEVREHLDEVEKTLQEKPASPPHGDRHISDQQIRTFDLGPANGRSGTAEYRMLLSAGHVKRSVTQGEKMIPGGEAMLKTVDFSQWFPAGSKAKLVRRGIVSCAGAKCRLVIEP
jgi:transglutaminase-like putative cysteine protease/tetratricopeptide (TPR) repeat protein